MARLSAGLPLLGLLAACAPTNPYPHASDLRFPRPSDPVSWRLYSDNPPIDSGLEPEAGPLQIFNWDSYIAPSLLRRFERDMGVKVELSTFYDMSEAIAKLRIGAVKPDIFFPTLDALGRLVVAELIRPLNHDYLSNFTNVWDELQSPFYDVGSRYTVPYAVYSTGIGWRNDLVREDIGTLANPWSIFANETYRGKVYVLDDYRTALSMILLQQGVTNINTEDAAQITSAAERLIDIGRRMSIKWSLDDYTLLPEGRAWIHQAWSGDMVTAPAYGQDTQDEVARTLSYWFPSDSHGEVSNDVVVIPKNAAHPVLAHAFIDYLLDSELTLENFTWLGYQQPLTTLTTNEVVGVFPWLGETNLRDALVTPTAIATGYRQLELSPGADALWQQAWLQFQSYG